MSEIGLIDSFLGEQYPSGRHCAWDIYRWPMGHKYIGMTGWLFWKVVTEIRWHFF